MGGTIHGAVAAQAVREPAAIAVVDGGQRFSYALLDAAADGYARTLRGRGVGPGGIVPVALPRSGRLVALLLGVLKCGAAYAAVDHRWPAARIRDLLGILDPPIFVAGADRPGAGSSRVWAPPAVEVAAAVADCGSVPNVASADPAAVFFTSGSTGVPKAVVSPHRATTRLFANPSTWWGPGRVMAQLAPVAWDAFSLEVWGPLVSGGTCVLSGSDHLLPRGLRESVSREGVDTVFLTTALFNLFVEEDPDCFRGLESVFTGGERLSVRHVARFLERYPGQRPVLWNCYGPVESCVFATSHRIHLRDCAGADGVPLGRAVPGTGLHVLDGVRECGAGEVGEICLSGSGLAVGYLGDPRLTARKFPTLPVGGVPRRLYRTGDLGFLDVDGVLHFRGRLDRQLKVAGHRVEPEEIEAVVRGVAGVGECVVAGVDGADGQAARLALFYSPRPGDGESGKAPSPAALRRELAVRLPAHLIPHLLRRCESFPLTPNGKVDRGALLASLRDPSASSGERRAAVGSR